MEKTCQVFDICQNKLKPRKQTGIFEHKTLMDTKTKAGENRNPQVFGSEKLKSRKKCLNGDECPTLVKANWKQ